MKTGFICKVLVERTVSVLVHADSEEEARKKARDFSEWKDETTENEEIKEVLGVE